MRVTEIKYRYTLTPSVHALPCVNSNAVRGIILGDWLAWDVPKFTDMILWLTF